MGGVWRNLGFGLRWLWDRQEGWAGDSSCRGGRQEACVGMVFTLTVLVFYRVLQGGRFQSVDLVEYELGIGCLGHAVVGEVLGFEVYLPE